MCFNKKHTQNMKIKFKNIKNIKLVDIDIDENKINHLYGITGTGKSTIVDVIKNKDVVNWMIPYNGNVEDTEIIDVPKEEVKVFNENTLNDLIINKDENMFYEIIFKNDKEIKIIEKRIIKLLETLDEFKVIIREKINDFSTFKNEIFKLNSKKDKLTASSSIKKIEKTLGCVELLQSKDIKASHLEWIKKGSKLIENKKCPFCFTSLKDEHNDFLESIEGIDKNHLNKLFEKKENINVFKDIGITQDEAIKNNDMFISKTKDYALVIGEYEVLLNQISYEKISIDNSNIDINLSDGAKSLIDGIGHIYDSFKENEKEYKKLIIETKQKIYNEIGANLKPLNASLSKASIPYKFQTERYSRGELKSSFILKPINNDYSVDTKYNLSTGEKSIIALVMFLLVNKETDNILIFDDPVSSSDEQRRNVMMNLIYELSGENTILILSHDQVYVKMVSQSLTKRNNTIFIDRTGKILHLANVLGEVTCTEICHNDFYSIKKHALENAGESYYSKLISVRLACEYDKRTDIDSNELDLVYGYVSCIYHNIVSNQKNLLKLVEDSIKNFNENKSTSFSQEEILQIIQNLYGIKLDKVDECFEIVVNTEELNNVEKVHYFRDVKCVEKIIKEELSSWVHLTSQQIISLNPYKFNTFSPLITKNIL